VRCLHGVDAARFRLPALAVPDFPRVSKACAVPESALQWLEMAPAADLNPEPLFLNPEGMASPSAREIVLAKFSTCTCSAALLACSSLLCALHVLPHGAHPAHDRRVLRVFDLFLFTISCFVIYFS
jgi:hypothetical protein